MSNINNHNVYIVFMPNIKLPASQWEWLVCFGMSLCGEGGKKTWPDFVNQDFQHLNKLKTCTVQPQSSKCKPILALVNNPLSNNNESLCRVQTVRHLVSHPVLQTVYQTNVVEQRTRTESQLGSIKRIKSSIHLIQPNSSFALGLDVFWFFLRDSR